MKFSAFQLAACFSFFAWLQAGAGTDPMRVESVLFPKEKPRTLAIDPARGIGPEEAAVIAVLMSPALKATRDKRGTATAQLITAGILPNPQINFERDDISGGNTVGTQNGFSSSASWEITSLLPLAAKQAAGRSNVRAVDLDVAWEEWQAAANARLAVYHVAAVVQEVAAAREADDALCDTVSVLRGAVATNETTMLELAIAESTGEEMHATRLEAEQDLSKQWLALKRALGIEPNAPLRLRSGILLPLILPAPNVSALNACLETHRIDLIGLRQGIASQDETVRATVLAAFPKITAGFTRNTDTTDVHTQGFTVQVDFPLFDRNQGNIADERATRQTLKDEYAERLFEARNDVAAAAADICSLNIQIAAAREAVPMLQRLVLVSGSAANTGNGGVLEFNEAKSNILQKKIETIKLEERLMEAKTALELASGQMEEN